MISTWCSESEHLPARTNKVMLNYQSFSSWFWHGEDNFYLAKINKELDSINGSITRPNMQLDSPNSQVQPGNLEKYEVGILLLHFSQITRSLWSLSLSLSFCSSFSFSLVSLSRSRLLVIRQAKTLFFSHVVNLAGRHVLWFLCPPLSRFHAEWTCTAHERFHDKAEDFGHRFTPVAHEASNISSAGRKGTPQHSSFWSLCGPNFTVHAVLKLFAGL